jgi:hypothetical protein
MQSIRVRGLPIEIAGIFLFFICFNFLQNELVLIFGRVGSEYVNKITYDLRGSTNAFRFFLWGVLKERVYQTLLPTYD